MTEQAEITEPDLRVLARTLAMHELRTGEVFIPDVEIPDRIQLEERLQAEKDWLEWGEVAEEDSDDPTQDGALVGGEYLVNEELEVLLQILEEWKVDPKGADFKYSAMYGMEYQVFVNYACRHTDPATAPPLRIIRLTRSRPLVM